MSLTLRKWKKITNQPLSLSLLVFLKYNWTFMFFKIQRPLQQLFSNQSAAEIWIIKILRFLNVSADVSTVSGIYFSCCQKITKTMLAICSALTWWSDITFFQRFWKTTTCCTCVLVSLHHRYLFPVILVCQIFCPVFSPWPWLGRMLGTSSRRTPASLFS